MEYHNGEEGAIMLDSGVGFSVWPDGWLKGALMMPKDPKLTMTAANGSAVENLGTKVIKFRGIGSDFGRQA